MIFTPKSAQEMKCALKPLTPSSRVSAIQDRLNSRHQEGDRTNSCEVRSDSNLTLSDSRPESREIDQPTSIVTGLPKNAFAASPRLDTEKQNEEEGYESATESIDRGGGDPDDIVEIEDGEFLRQCSNPSESRTTLGLKSRNRFKITGLPQAERPRWQCLREAVALDYIQKGPDSPAAENEVKKKHGVDDPDVRRLIRKRYRQLFSRPGDPEQMTELQIEMVNILFSPLINIQVRQRCTNFANLGRRYIVDRVGMNCWMVETNIQMSSRIFATSFNLFGKY